MRTISNSTSPFAGASSSVAVQGTAPLSGGQAGTALGRSEWAFFDSLLKALRFYDPAQIVGAGAASMAPRGQGPGEASIAPRTSTAVQPAPASASHGMDVRPARSGVITDAHASGSPVTAASASQSPSKPSSGVLSDEQRCEARSTLLRHQDFFGKGIKQDKIDRALADPSTPPDLKKALEAVQSDKQLKNELDGGKKDGVYAAWDVRKMSEQPGMRDHLRSQAKEYTNNYIPSQDGGENKARPMEEADAQREMYRFSDSLPKQLSTQTLQDIVDGRADVGKCPPQLKAAAQYYLDNPEKWKSLNGGDTVDRQKMLNHISDKVPPTAAEKAAIDTIQANPDVFFKDGNLNRDKLKRIADDPKLSEQHRSAATTLLESDVLFGQADNAKHGHKPGGLKKLVVKVDDGQLSKGDINALQGKLAQRPAASEPAPPTRTPDQPKEVSAVNDMLAAQSEAPEVKAGKGGALKDVGAWFLKGFALVGKAASMVLEKIASAGIPLISQAAAAGAVVTRGVAAGMDVGAAAIEGRDVEQEGIKGAMAVAGTAASVIPGGGAVVGSAMGVVKSGAAAGGIAMSEPSAGAVEQVGDVLDRI